MHSTGNDPANKPQPALRRSLSLSLVIFYGLGNILGAGVYVLIGKVAAYAGYQAPLSFLLASLLAGFTAFSYAELSARYPFSAGEVVYIQDGLGIRPLAILTGLLIIMAGIVSAATIARGFTGYLQVFTPFPALPAIVLLVTCLGALAAWGITQSILVAAVMTVVEIAGLLLILWVARPDSTTLLNTLSALTSPVDAGSARGIFLGAFLAFYAFIGFEDMVNVAEEVRQPQRNLPRAILTALGISTLLYFAVAVVAVSVVTPAQLAASDAPLAYIYQQASQADPLLIAAISMIAVVNGALIQIIMASRVCYGMGNRGWAPPWLARVHPATRTPVLATGLVTLLVMLMALWLPLESLARATSFFILLVFVLVNLSLWRIKRRAADSYQGFSVYRWVPAVGAAGALAFIALQLASSLAGSV
ncbi:MAG: APC family permease [Gammaproteobacteria bacterium]